MIATRAALTTRLPQESTVVGRLARDSNGWKRDIPQQTRLAANNATDGIVTTSPSSSRRPTCAAPGSVA